MNALVFPGQGSQKIGMAKAMVEKYAWAREIANQTDQILGRPLIKLCFEGPEEALKETVNTQPALFFVSGVITEALKREKFPFAATAGHSLGEYSALYAAGAASYQDLLRLTDFRARLMQKACPTGKGAMAAVLMLDRENTREACKEASVLGPCVVANFNCPGQIVISGAKEAVEKAGKLALDRGARRVIPLEVSGPFHSPLMEPAHTELAAAIERISFAETRVMVYANVDAAPTNNPGDFKRKLLDQLMGSVQWEDSIQAMWKDGFRRFVEAGPGKVLSGLIKKIVPEAKTEQVQDPESLFQALNSEKAQAASS